MPWATMTEPRFSIITVTKNNLPGLHATHASLQEQTFTNYEWIVIDGASSDGTLDQFTPDLSEPDAGPFDAMNKGMEKARGDYLLFLNAGDTLAAPDVLEKIAKADADFIYGDSLENSYYKSAKSPDCTHHSMITHHQAMFYRRAAIGDLCYNLHYPIAADYDFTWRFLDQKPSIAYMNFPICRFECGGLSQRHAPQGRHEQFRIRHSRNMPIIFCVYIYARQIAAQLLRNRLPAFFWRLRCRGNNAPWRGHSQTLPARPENRVSSHTRKQTSTDRAVA